MIENRPCIHEFRQIYIIYMYLFKLYTIGAVARPTFRSGRRRDSVMRRSTYTRYTRIDVTEIDAAAESKRSPANPKNVFDYFIIIISSLLLSLQLRLIDPRGCYCFR